MLTVKSVTWFYNDTYSIIVCTETQWDRKVFHHSFRYILQPFIISAGGGWKLENPDLNYRNSSECDVTVPVTLL